MNKIGYNYFEVLDLEVDFWCEDRMIEKQFQKMQKMRHPDEGFESTMEVSMLINEAYENLINPILRAKHILEINGIDTDVVPTSVKMFTMLENAEEAFKSSYYRMYQYLEEEDFEAAHKEWYQCNIYNRFMEIKNQKSYHDRS